MRDGLRPVDGLEDGFGGLPELEVGRVEQALLVLLVEEVLGRDELEDVNAVAEDPSHARPRRRAAPASVSERVM